jgi:Fungal fruit body lectin
MSYKITARVYQTNPNAWFEIIEKTVWNYANGGTWTVVDDKQVLTMGGSGTSGILRFKSGSEYFIVALGVHNYKRWVDVSTGLPTSDTAAHIHPDYYTAGNYRATVREKQLSSFDVTSPQGRRITVNFTVAEGHELACDIVIH